MAHFLTKMRLIKNLKCVEVISAFINLAREGRAGSTKNFAGEQRVELWHYKMSPPRAIQETKCLEIKL